MPSHEYYQPSRRLVSQDDAAIIENANVPRSRFTGQWNRKTTFDAGYLVPFLVDEVLPGDHLKYSVEAYVRLSTPLFPIMDSQRVDTHFFYVPCRLLWTNWVRFMGEQDNPADSIAFTVPQMLCQQGGYDPFSIFDHMGLPTQAEIDGTDQVSHNALPLRAYNQIWNEWFRDENLVDRLDKIVGDTDTYNSYTLAKRAKSHDYFTSALPWPQKFTAPNIPLAGMAPVLGIGSVASSAQSGPITVRESDLATDSYAFYKQLWNPGAADESYMKFSAGTGGYPMVFADLAAVSGIGINILRQAWLVQSLLERDARGGTRYVELIRSHFGVTNPDFRLQRPEYIGGGSTALQITPIAQTAPTDDLTVGALGAAGTASGSHSASYAATEHGYILGLISVKTELSYSQGMHRMYSRLTRYDFPWPSLMGLGEQAILRKEIYIKGGAAGVAPNDDIVFGYQERWHEYRTRVSEVTGAFRSGVAGTLDVWHLSQRFGSPPTLSEGFIEENPPMTRVLAAAELAAGQQYLADILIQRTAVRPISMYGTPSQLGRF